MAGVYKKLERAVAVGAKLYRELNAAQARIRELEAENAKLYTAIASWLKEEICWKRIEAKLDADVARKDAALGAAEVALDYTYKRIAGKSQQVVIEDARALIAKAKEEK